MVPSRVVLPRNKESCSAVLSKSECDICDVAGKLLIGADQYSFAAIAKPYAQELLDRDSTQNYTIRHYSQQVSILTTCQNVKLQEQEIVPH